MVDDDRVPYLNNFTGTEIFAEAFGCKGGITMSVDEVGAKDAHQAEAIAGRLQEVRAA